ncbi:MAG: vWA domain-containing protein [Allosphingosinicella sp.]
MRRSASLGFVALSVSLCLTTSGPAVSHPHPDGQGGQGLCRRAAMLPQLPPEPRDSQQQNRYEPPPHGGPVPVPVPMSPPPPPAAPMAGADDGTAEIAVTGSRVARPSVDSASPVTAVDARETSPPPESVIHPTTPPPPYRPGPQPQAGLLTAGDHDDLLNPALYARYVARFLDRMQIAGVPRLDTARTLTVAVEDTNGRPVPFAPVRVTCADGNSLVLRTLADGTAVFFPALDRLGERVRLSVDRSGQQARDVVLHDAPGGQRQTVTFSHSAAPVRKFDLLLAIDTTGSMGDEMAYLKAELRSILDALKRSHPGLDIRLGLVAYKDEGDVYVTRTYPFTSSLMEMQGHLASHHADGGGDYPEAMDQALIRAVGLNWREDAVKSLLLVADAPPHDRNVARTWAAAEAARARRIQIVPVAASGVADTAEYVMRAMAAATQSRYIFLTDDSGIGNPHAPPAVACHLVTRLDTMVRRVLDSQISGRRVEPREGEVIRTVGRYDNGKCILPPDFSAQ